MRVATKFLLHLTPVLFGLLLIPRAALAGTADCPTEPASNVPLAGGEIRIGANCTLHTAGDVDSFVFTGTNGDTYQLAVAITSGSTNICMTLRSPSSVVYSGCSNIDAGQDSVVTSQTLTATGSYTIDISEPSTDTMDYAVSLERLNPFPPNGLEIGIDEAVAGDIAEPTDSNAFTFKAVSTGEYQVSATLTGGSQNLCMTVYEPGGASAYSGCTNIAAGQDTVQLSNFTPPQSGTYMAFVVVAGNDGTAPFSLEVSCISGKCNPYPYCALTDSLSYTSGTLTMNFTVDNSYATTWNAWLTYQNTIVPLFSVAQKITDSPIQITKTATLSAEGNVGVLSTLTTPTAGITCSSWVQIQTAAP
jgi:hypothetical protein